MGGTSGLTSPVRAGDENTDAAPGRRAPSVVLLVEDNAADVYVIDWALKQSGIRIDIQVASDGEQALAILKRSEENPEDSCPTLILLDWNLPKVSGAEVLAYVRQSARWQNIPVVVVTSSNSPADVEQLRRLGATVHFLKPTDLDAYLELRRIVRGLLPEAPLSS